MIGDLQSGGTQRLTYANRESFTGASRGILGWEGRAATHKLDGDRRPRPMVTSGRHACALRVENLEVRSVLSGSSPLGLSVFTFAFHLGPVAVVPIVSQPTVVSTSWTLHFSLSVSAPSLIQDVASIADGPTATVADVSAGQGPVVAGVVGATTSGGHTSDSKEGGSAGMAGAGVAVGNSGLDVLSSRTRSDPSRSNDFASDEFAHFEGRAIELRNVSLLSIAEMSETLISVENDGAGEPGLPATGLSVPVTTPVPEVGIGEDTVMGGSPAAARNSAGQTVVSAEPDVPAELIPADLEDLEHALARLMQQFNEARADLAERVSRIGMTEMLAAAGLVALAHEVTRRTEQRMQFAKTQLAEGFSQLPGPFYLPSRDRFDGSVRGNTSGTSAVI
jgi:hypothetical protein